MGAASDVINNFMTDQYGDGNMRVVEFVGEMMAPMRIQVPRALIGLRSRTSGWRKGELVCTHTLLTMISCMTTRVLPTQEERFRALTALRGFLYCLAHYFPPWFGFAVRPELHQRLERFFVHQSHQPLSAPVAAQLFRLWAIPEVLGVRGDRPETAAALLAAYDPHGVDKTAWAYPVWTLLHMIPSSAPLALAPPERDRATCAANECLYFRALLVALADLIPCPQCRSHKWEYCTGKAVEGRGAFRTYVAAWVWEFHNAVTLRTRGPEALVALDQALQFWDAQTDGWWNEVIR